MFLDTFYYKEPISGKEYTHLPSGRPNINRLLDQKTDFWEKPCYQEGEKKKKQLIFLDWLVLCLSNDKRENYLQQLQLLFDEGFNVWLPTYNALLLLREASDLTACAGNWNPSASMAIQMATQQGIARDHIAILDYFAMGQCFPALYTMTNKDNAVTQQFYQNTNISDPLLKASHLDTLSCTNPPYYLQISKELIAQPPASLSVIVDVGDDNSTLLGLLAKLSAKKLLLINTSTKILQIIQAIFSNVEELHVVHHETSFRSLLRDVKLPKLKAFHLATQSLDTAELHGFLLGCKKLITLYLDYPSSFEITRYNQIEVYETNLNGLFKGLELPELIELSLLQTTLELPELLSFLRQCKKLTSLRLLGCKVDFSGLFNDLELLTLRNLTICSSDISDNQKIIDNFTARHPHLKLIDYKFVKEMYGYVAPGKTKTTKSTTQHEEQKVQKQIAGARGASTTENFRKHSHSLIDTDTTFNPEKTFTVQTYFTPDPGAHHYRLKIYDGLNQDEEYLRLTSIKTSLQLLPKEPYASKTINQEEGSSTYIGQVVMTLNATDWISLPSLSSQEQLTAYHASSALEFAYAENTNQYYVRLTPDVNQKTQTIQIQYQLKVNELPVAASWENSGITPEALKWVKKTRFEADGTLKKNAAYRQLNKLTLQQRIAVLTHALKGFEIETSDRTQHTTMKNYTEFNYLLEKQVGACRHRVYLFLALAAHLGIKVRCITNDCHAFIEINYEGKWIKQDLGGYSVQLHIKPLQTLIVDGLSAAKTEEVETKQSLTNASAEEKEKTITSSMSVVPQMRLFTTLFTEAITQLEQQLATYDLNQKQAMLIFSDGNDIESFYVDLCNEKDQCNQHVLYLPSFRDLIFKTIKITQTDIGYEKIDSPFIRDLKQLKTGDVLLINFDRYQMTDVGYNTLFDIPRRLGDISIPEGVVIIAAMDLAISQRMGEDILSRVPVKKSWQLPLLERDVLEFTKGNVESDLVIDLYDDCNYWKEQLIGQLQYVGQVRSPFTFKLGVFQQTVTENKNIEIRHAPINTDLSCKRFFADLAKYRTIESNGEKIHLPKSLTWQLTHPAYEFKGKMMGESMQAGMEWDQLLSTYTFDGLFYRHHYCNRKSTFIESTGLLADYANNTLRLYVTQNLPESQWAKLCHQANQYNCRLHFILGENVQLPSRLTQVIKPTSSLTVAPVIKAASFSAECYQSNDTDLTLSQLKQRNGSCIVIHVAQNTSYADLVSLIQLDTSKNSASLHSFNIQDGELLKQLKAGKTVILKGVFSDELASQLANLFAANPFLQTNGELHPLTTGQIILVTDQKDAFTFLAKDKRYKKQDFSDENRFEQLAQEAVSKPILEKLKKHLQNSQTISWNYTQLKTIAQTLKTQPAKNPLKSFSLFFSNPMAINQLGEKLKQRYFFSNLKKWIQRIMKRHFFRFKPHQEEKKRLKKLTTQLDATPYVFIIGPSGIGKSTLIIEKLQPYYANKGQTLQLSVGMDQMVRWASDTHLDKIHILFLDEANLSKEGSFNCFEGLFDDPPAIFIHGKQYPLTPQHKLIFCGNPTKFQSRQTHQFFQRHGRGLQFKNWSDRFLLLTILGPLLAQTNQTCSLALSKTDQKQVAEFLLKGYQSLSKQTQPQQSLTPRNLQMMLLRFAILCQKNNLRTPLQNAYLALYDEIKPYLPKPLRKQWKLNFQQDKSYRDLRASHRETSLLPLGDRYIVPPSRRRTLQLIQDHLAIREKRIITPELKTQGLHGLLLEGASGIGKSALVIELLKELGYQEANVDSTKRYYYLTLTDPAKIDKVLIKAFHEGAIVVIDELNTAPVEKILNALMSGVDLAGNLAQQAGFFVVGTQNPISFSNRQPLSPALANRFYKIDVKEYSMTELQHILIHKGLEKNETNTKLKIYEEHNNHTSIEALKYTPRDLFRGALKK
ncbi:MAG: AAA family ATPase [Cellulomonas sp.]|nr:AAA family ATPase [Rickettsiella sp.]